MAGSSERGEWQERGLAACGWRTYEPLVTITLEPDWNAPGTPLRHTWSGMVNVDQFRWLSRADVLSQLEMARDELGARFVRACAMYSPETRVFARPLRDWRNAGAASVANWQYVDLSIEALLDRGLKPVYTTCFMPPGFSESGQTCWPDRNCIGMPRHLEQWAEFVSDGLRHHMRRFGRREVLGWPVECWNEPNLASFFDGSREDFFRLWKATWEAVKRVDEGLRIGGPSTARGEWLEPFLDFAGREGVPPDYLISHVYNNDSESQPLCPFDGPASHRVEDTPHFAAGVIRGVGGMLRQLGWSGEMHWNEWGRSWFPHDPLKETALEASFVVKTMAEVSQEADVFAFWCLSDIYDQAGFQAAEFDGHYGMLSLHGLRKPAYFAHQFLCALAKQRLAVRGGNLLQNAVATRDSHGARVLVYNHPEKSGSETEKTNFTIALPPGSQSARITMIDSRENNIIAFWREMGATPSPDKNHIARLREANHVVSRPVAIETYRDRGSGVSFTLECPGVALVECKVGWSSFRFKIAQNERAKCDNS